MQYLTQAGVKSTFIHLADIGIHGNGHMMMLEKNSDVIAGVMESWLDKTLPSKSTNKQSSHAAGRSAALREGRAAPAANA